MFTFDIKEKIDKEIDKGKEKCEKFLSNIKSIYEDESEKDLCFLRERGYDLDRYEGITPWVLAKQKLSEGLVPQDLITKLAIKYRLRFLPLRYFKGLLPSNVTQEMKKIEGEEQFKSNHQYYVLAPKSSFRLEPKPKDPILFVTSDEKFFKPVVKWGSDMSIFRALKMYALRSARALVFVHFLLTLIVIALGFVNAMFFYLTIVTVASCAVGGLLMDLNDDFEFSTDNWSSAYK